MVVFKLQKKRMDSFLRSLQHDHELIAPVRKDLIRFLKINDTGKIHLDGNAYFPLKEWFFRKEEIIFTFDGKKIEPDMPNTPPRIFFGVRKCDLNAIQRQDMVNIHDVKDPHYSEARDNSILIGYHCDRSCDEFAFCGSMDLDDFHDLMVYEKSDHYLVDVGSEKGQTIINKNNKLFTETDIVIRAADMITPGTDRLKKEDISGLYESKGWKDAVSMCFSCGACTTLCPTCYCFEIKDDVPTENPSGCVRCKVWSSCQLKSFTRVAGNHIFRDDREERFKHRIYHQLDYFKKKYGKNLCVGCGRCISGCPTRIDFVNHVNKME